MSESLKNIVGAGGGGCFRKGSLVQLEGGKTKPIELINVGDEVLSFDESGAIHVSKVTHIHHHSQPEPLLAVSFWGGKIHITPNHWVLNQYNAFVEMGALTTHDALVDGMGHLRPITGATAIEPEPVYNLTVFPNHTFICDGIRVHNGGYRNRFPVAGKGGGGSGKGGGGRAAVEDPDSLQSRAVVSILDVIGEGQIGGLVDGARSILVNDTPLQDADGKFNFAAASYEQRTGEQTQTPIPGSPDVESPTAVSVKVTTVTPQIFTITNKNIDRVRIIVATDGLISQDTSTGDIHGASVSFKFQLSVNGTGYADIVPSGSDSAELKISGKTRSKYQRSYDFVLPKSGQPNNNIWSIKMVRISPDSTSSALRNDIYLDSYVEIIDSRLSYPNTALIGMTISAEQFNSIPSRAYLVDGLYIKVPSNYDPVTRAYDGIWNGTFKMAISNNPAWVLYDLLVTERYGLGQFIKPSNVDKAELYRIGQYCDQMIPDGMGGTTPRFTINTVIQTVQEAYKLISDITSVFRGMAYWNGNMVGLTADMPTEPTMIFTQANVIDGLFSYTGSSRKDRHSVALVAWNDPNDRYKQKVEYVEDAELVETYGIRKLEFVSFGCTSQTQARLAGLWALYTEKYESDVVTFAVGADSIQVRPGNTAIIHDSNRAGKRLGGRLIAATPTTATLDSTITIGAGATIAMKLADGTFVEQNLLTSGTTNVVEWLVPLTSIPQPGSIFVVSEPSLVPMTVRIMGVEQGEQHGTFQITAVQHNPNKYNEIEQGVTVVPPPISILKDAFLQKPSNVEVKEHTYEIAPGIYGLKLSASWEGNSQFYDVTWRRIQPNPTNAITSRTSSTTFDIDNVTDGQYEITIVGGNYAGRFSQSTSVQRTVSIQGEPAYDVTGLTLLNPWTGSSAQLVWNETPLAKEYAVQVLVNGVVKRTTKTATNEFEYTSEMAKIDGGPWRQVTFKVKAVSYQNINSTNWATLDANNPQCGAVVSIEAIPGFRSFDLIVVPPPDADLDGIAVYLGLTPNFTPGPGNRVYAGPNSRIYIAFDQNGAPIEVKDYYVRVAAFDKLGLDDLTYSTAVKVTPLPISGGISPAEITAQLIAPGAVDPTKIRAKRVFIY